MTFDDMIDWAKKTLNTIKEAPGRLPGPLVYVLLTDRGTLYTVVNDDFETVLQNMRRENDTVALKVLAMWDNETVDVPSYAFRKALLGLNVENGNAEILLRTEGGYGVKSMDKLM